MSTRRNSELIGVPGGVAELSTPVLIVDLDRFKANVRRMQNHCDESKILLRPHTKTHKSVRVATLQIAAGAVGICCAKLGEAAVLAAGSVNNILITSPVATKQAIKRLVNLKHRHSEISAVVDNLSVADAISTAMAERELVLDVLVDLDPGLHRTGIPIGERAISLISHVVQRCNGLCFRGVQFYSGDLMHVREYEQRTTRSQERLLELQAFINTLEAQGINCEIVSGGGTGTYDIDPATEVLTELQAGSYPFMDRQYLEVQDSKGEPMPFEPSLFVLTTVISSNHPNFSTTDAGLKAFATDADSPWIASGAPLGCTYRFMGDEHGAIHWGSEDKVPVGSVIKTIVPHCDPTINLYDCVHVIENDTLVEIWDVDARGRSD